MRWIVVIAAMAAKRQRTDAQQCDESALPYEVATYAFTISARDGHAIDARVYAPAAKETVLRQNPGPLTRTTRSPASSTPTAAAFRKALVSPSRSWAAASHGGA